MILGIASIENKERIAGRQQVSTNVAKVASPPTDARPVYAYGGPNEGKSSNVDSEIQLSKIGGWHEACEVAPLSRGI
jgi:hypothetical protein